MNFPGGSTVKNPPAMQKLEETWVGHLGQEDPLEEGNSNSLQYSCLKNPMDRGAWWATVHWVAKSRTQLGNFTGPSFYFNLILQFISLN